MTDDLGRITSLLQEADSGSAGAMDKVLALVYSDLERMAGRHLRKRYGGNLAGATLEPAALVNETYLKLIRQRTNYDNRGHFFAIATRVMLRVLADYERSKNRVKRGGGQLRVTLSGEHESLLQPDRGGMEGFTSALEELQEHDRRAAEIAALRLIWGLTIAEISETLAVSRRTVERSWKFARAWLEDALGQDSA